MPNLNLIDYIIFITFLLYFGSLVDPKTLKKIFLLCCSFVLVVGDLKVILSISSKNIMANIICYLLYIIIILGGSLGSIIFSFEVFDMFCIHYQLIDPTNLFTTPVIVERLKLPNDDIIGLPHPLRMWSSPWATAGAALVFVFVGAITIYKACS